MRIFAKKIDLISSSVPKTYYKTQKIYIMTIFIHLFCHFYGFEIILWEEQENFQVLGRF